MKLGLMNSLNGWKETWSSLNCETFERASPYNSQGISFNSCHEANSKKVFNKSRSLIAFFKKVVGY